MSKRSFSAMWCPVTAAACDAPIGDSRALTLVIAVVALACYTAAVWVAIARPGPGRRSAGAVYLVGLVAGAVVVMTPHGLHDPRGEYVWRVATGLVLSSVIGVVAFASARSRPGRWRMLAAAPLGSIVLVGVVLLLLVVYLAVTGTCLD